MINKICLITPSHICTNPRLVKEAQALISAGFTVTVIFTQNLDFLVDHDFQVLSENPKLKYKVLNISKSNKKTKILRIAATTFSKFSEVFSPLVFRKYLEKFVINRYYLWQLREALKTNADLYIAHNLGALPIAYTAAQKTGSKCGFDAEDFHRGELTIGENDKKLQNIIAIEDYYLPKVNYKTGGSPLIANKYSEIYQNNVTSIINVFPKTQVAANANYENGLVLFWFSQTIGPNRGLETIVKALNLVKTAFTLHLLGNCDSDYKTKLLLNLRPAKQSSIIFHHSIPPSEIFERCQHFHIGFASEPSIPVNRNLALSNKIFTYIQAGLAILASKTQAQEELLKQYPEMGFIYPQEDYKRLAELIDNYGLNQDLLKRHQKNAFHYGQTVLNWEVEQKKFLDIIQHL